MAECTNPKIADTMKSKSQLNQERVFPAKSEVHGTAALRTERLLLRRYCPEDAEPLYQHLGTDPKNVQYSGWNPYATPKMAQEMGCHPIPCAL